MVHTKICLICKNEFYQNCTDKDWADRKFCSKHCSNSRVKKRGLVPILNIAHGLNGYNRYSCRCDVCREAIRQRKRQHRSGVTIPREMWGHKEELNPAWKGDGVGYKNIHDWVRRHKNKTGTCLHCNKYFGVDRGHATQWANVDHSYERDLDDYIELCPSCHKKYDLANNLGNRVK